MDVLLVVYFKPKIAFKSYQSFLTQPGLFVSSQLDFFVPKLLKYVLYVKYL